MALDFGSVDAVDRETLAALQETVHELEVVLAEVEDPSSHPFREAGLTEWTPIVQERVGDLARKLSDAAARLKDSLQEFAQLLGAESEGLSLDSLENLEQLGHLLAASPVPPEDFLLGQDWEQIATEVRSSLTLCRKFQELDGELSGKYRPTLFELDLQEFQSNLSESHEKRWPFSWLKSRTAIREMKGAFLGKKLPKGPPLLGDVELALERNELRNQLDRKEAAARDLLGHRWQGVDTDWSRVGLVVDWCDQARTRVNRLAGTNLEERRRLRESFARVSVEGRDMFVDGGPGRRRLEAFREALNEVLQLQRDLRRVLEIDVDSQSDRESIRFVERAQEQAASWTEHLSQLRGWCSFLRARFKVEKAGLLPLVRAIEAGDIRRRDLPAAFEHSFYRWWVNQLFDAEPALRRFTGTEHEDRIRRFRNLERTIAEDTPRQIQSRLADRIPLGGVQLSTNSSSEMGILRRELQKQRRHLPIRRLFQEIPNVISRLKPCFLMSPLSVAQYLDFNFPEFDLVVFDEASQIPVWDAIGAIRRGSKLVVVGDSKQLPPTNFFQRAEEEALFQEDIEELDSILDECIAARLPRLHLGWHYRSRHESLIAFSNHHYYENRLLTFPSPQGETSRLGLSLRVVQDGVYDRGKSRANKAEAAAVVREIVDRLKSSRGEEESIGVVTFSQAQQTRIEDLLDRARRKNPEIDRHFTSEVEEPVFVKNLENVQGDERDVILFSICYGPDLNGRVAMNFGPLNRDGGERRLNVAVTRARRQVVIFSSMTADHIDLARTKALGVRHLKAYLEYAEVGEEALGKELGIFGDAEAESPFEEEVIRALVERGYQVQPQVGCSGYRIDIGVKDPDLPGRYLLGVECDGAMYHSAKTARDRDRLRAAVLESLGWYLHRIWSTDWWQNPVGETEKLVAAIEAAKNRRGVVEETPDSAPVVEVSRPDSDLFANAQRQPTVAPSAPNPLPRRKSTPADLGGTPYPKPLNQESGGSPEDFYEDRFSMKLRAIAMEALAAEAPIAFTRLARIVAEPFGLSRATGRLKARVREILPRSELKETPGCEESFLWQSDQVPESLEGFRFHDAGDAGKRAPQEITPQEIANAALEVLRLNVSMGSTDLARETAKLFGYKSLGKKVARCMANGIQLLESRANVVVKDDTLTLI